MRGIIRGEFLKARRTSTYKLLVLAPSFIVLSSLAWSVKVEGAYNFWYTLVLPGTIAIISGQSIAREKKLDYKGLAQYPLAIEKFYLAKVIYTLILLMISSLVFLLEVMVLDFIFSDTIPLSRHLVAMLVMIVTFSFQIPLSIFLTRKFNIFLGVIFNVLMVFMGVISYETRFAYVFYPYGLTSRLFVYILGILPNGLAASMSQDILSTSLIQGLIFALVLFLLLTLGLMRAFKNEELN